MKKSLLLAFTFLYALPVQASVQDLIESIKNKDLSKTELLLQKGEDVNAANEQGNTPLHYAVATNNADMARLLLKYGADMNAENTKGWSPLKIAQTKNVQEVTEVLIAALNAPAEEDAEDEDEEEVVVEEQMTVSDTENAEDSKLIEEATRAVEEAQRETERALSEQKKTTNELKQAQQKIKTLEQKIQELEKTNAQQKKELAQTAEKLKTVMAASAMAKPVANDKPAAKEKPQAQPKPEKKAEPVQKPQPPVPSKLNSALTAGDEEIIYCMNILGQVENPNMISAAGFYASSVGINHARYNEITSIANAFYSGSKEDEIKTTNEKCAKIITPSNMQKQNQIIRSLNQARGI